MGAGKAPAGLSRGGAGGLVPGSIPLFLGLIVVMPVPGHASWHLYRRLVAGQALLRLPRHSF